MSTSQPPLGAPRWRRSFEDFFLAKHSPLMQGDQLIARLGDEVIAVNPEDGSTCWRSLLAEDAGNGSFFIGQNGWLIGEVRRWPERLSSIVGLNTDGSHRWRTDFDALILPQTAQIYDGRLFFVILDEGRSNLLRMDPADGRIESKQELPYPANEVMLVGDKLLCRCKFGEPGVPKLFTVDTDTDGEMILELSDEIVWDYATVNNEVVAVVQQDFESPFYLVAWNEAFKERWRIPTAFRSIAITSDVVFHINKHDDAEYLVCRDIKSGEECWRTVTPTAAQGRHGESIWAGGHLVGCNRNSGLDIFDSRDGTYLGNRNGYWAPPLIVGDCSYWVGGKRELLCMDLP